MDNLLQLMQIFCFIIMALALVFGITVLFGAPYVPSLASELSKMFKKLYPLGPKDFLIDMGSGDGIVLKVASEEFGARALGVELHPVLSFLSRIRLRKIKPLPKIVCQNYLNFSFPKETTVIYTFSDSRDVDKIYQKIQKEANRLNKELYFISNGFAAEGAKIEKQYSSFYLYLVKPDQARTDMKKLGPDGSGKIKTKSTAKNRDI